MTSRPTLRLPDTVSSAQDLAALIMELHECLKWLSHESVKKKVGVKDAAPPPDVSSAAKELMHEHGTAQEKLEGLIQELETAQRRTKLITITLAAQPSNSVKATLVGWCRKEIAPDVLVNFNFNRAILGGMVVRAGSRVFDWSFRRSLLANADTFPEVLRHV